MGRRPNVLLIQTDQHRYDGLGLNGNPVVQTPAIDKLGAEGMVLDRAYVQSPLCMPSRATLMTGQYPRSHGVWVNGVPLPEHTPTLATMFRQSGYRTAGIGKLHLTPYNMGPYPDGAVGVTPFPESFDHWATMRARFSDPYFDFESVELTLGHNRPAGHYGDWLREHHPEALELFRPDAALSAPSGAMQSWRSALPVEYHSSTWIGEHAMCKLRDLASLRSPFFMWVSFPDPHHPFAPPDPYASMYDANDMAMPARRPGELADKPPHFAEFAHGGVMHDGAYPEDRPDLVTDDQLREITAHSYGMISLVDHNVGRVLEELERLGLADDTIVLFTSDHGELLGDHGLMLKGPFMYESLIKVPFVIRYPRQIRQGRSAALFGHVDVLPTLADLAGIELTGPVSGRSAAEVLRNPRAPAPRDAILSEYRSAYWAELHMKTLCTDRWKLTCYPTSGDGELYDLRNDPFEFDNLFHDPAHLATRQQLTERLVTELISTEPAGSRRYAHA